MLKDPIALFSSEWLASRFGMDVAVLIRHPAAFTASVKRLHLRHPFDHFLAQPLLMQDWLEPFAGEIERFAAAEQDIVDQGILLWLILHHAIAGFQERHPEWLFVRLEDLSNPVPEFRQVFADLDLELTTAWSEWWPAPARRRIPRKHRVPIRFDVTARRICGTGRAR